MIPALLKKEKRLMPSEIMKGDGYKKGEICFLMAKSNVGKSKFVEQTNPKKESKDA